MSNILITGIAGSGASYLAEYIVQNHPEIQVHGISRWHSTASKKNIESIKNKIILHECDLNDLGSIIRVLREVKPKKIFHMAATANVKVCFDTPLAVLQNNIMSTANLLEAVRIECPETIFQHCSTSEIYGNPITTPITEDHPLAPVNIYAVSKLSAEKTAMAYYHSWKLNIIITRTFAYINPRRGDIFSTIFAKQIALIEAGKLDVLRHGNLFSTRTLMDVRDMAKAYWLASDKCEYGTPYNIGGTDILEVGEFMMKLIEHAKCYIWTYEYSNLIRPVDVTKQVCDASKFNNKTGFTIDYTLDNSIDFLLDNVRKEVIDET